MPFLSRISPSSTVNIVWNEDVTYGKFILFSCLDFNRKKIEQNYYVNSLSWACDKKYFVSTINFSNQTLKEYSNTCLLIIFKKN